MEFDILRRKLLLLFLVIPCIVLGQGQHIKVENGDIWIKALGLESRQEGQPIIVFESGLGTPMDHWEPIVAGARKLGPLLFYDRPGIGKSSPDEELPTLKNVADKLIAIFQKLNVDPPYLLVGHSLGGVYVRGFAVYYPHLLAGLVIIDPGDFTETQKNKRDYYEVLHWDEARIDLEINKNITRRHTRLKDASISIQEESQVLEQLREHNFNEIKESPLPNIPVHIIVGGRFDLPKKLRNQEYDSELLFRSKLKHRVNRYTKVIESVEIGRLFYSADAGHFVHRDDPELVLASIRLALQDYEKLIEDKKK